MPLRRSFPFLLHRRNRRSSPCGFTRCTSNFHKSTLQHHHAASASPLPNAVSIDLILGCSHKASIIRHQPCCCKRISVCLCFYRATLCEPMQPLLCMHHHSSHLSLHRDENKCQERECNRSCKMPRNTMQLLFHFIHIFLGCLDRCCCWPFFAWSALGFFSCSSRFTTWFSACLLFGRCGFFFGLCVALCFALCFGLGGSSFAIGLCFSFSLGTKLTSFWYLHFRRFRAFYRLRRFRTFIGFRTRSGNWEWRLWSTRARPNKTGRVTSLSTDLTAQFWRRFHSRCHRRWFHWFLTLGRFCGWFLKLSRCHMQCWGWILIKGIVHQHRHAPHTIFELQRIGRLHRRCSGWFWAWFQRFGVGLPQ